METIHVACAADDNMFMPALAMCHSVCRHSKNKIHFHLMYTGVSTKLRKCLHQLMVSSRTELSLYRCDRDFSAYSSGTRYPPSIFLRLALFDQIAGERCIYLDADTMVRTDLTQLWLTNLNSKPIAACIDNAFLNTANFLYNEELYTPNKYLETVLEMKSGAYCNSGVMVVDLSKWRSHDLTRKVLEYCMNKTDLLMPDQDAINRILDGEFEVLHPSYNSLCYLRYYLSRKKRRRMRRTLGAWQKPNIVHFADISKPWEPLHFPTDFDSEFWNGIAGTAIEKRIHSRFISASSHCANSPGKRVRRHESYWLRIARSRALRRITSNHDLDPPVNIQWIGEALCTLAKVIRPETFPQSLLHRYGAAIIRNSEMGHMRPTEQFKER